MSGGLRHARRYDACADPRRQFDKSAERRTMSDNVRPTSLDVVGHQMTSERVMQTLICVADVLA